jgi:lipopolysaccharide export system permease protein
VVAIKTAACDNRAVPGLLLRYLLKAVLLRAVVALPALCVVYLAFHLGDQGRLVAAQAGWGVALRTSLLHLPLVAVQVLPAVMLLSSVLAYNSLRRQGELEALQARGMAPAWHCLPVLLAGALGALTAFALDELVVPACEQRADRIQGAGQTSPLTGLGAPAPWLHIQQAGTRRFMHRTDQGRLLVLVVNGAFAPIRRVDGRLRPGGGQGERTGRVVETRFGAEELTRSTVAQLHLPGVLELGRLGTMGASPRAEALSALALLGRLERLKQGGHARPAERLVLHSKLAFPLINIVVALLGCAFAVRVNRPAPVRDLAGAVVMLTGVWLALATGWVLGRSAILPAWAGVWGPVGLSLLAGGLWLIWCLARQRRFGRPSR